MVDEKKNGVASLEEFRRAALAERETRAEIVDLPSGLKARLVRPTPTELLLRDGQLPQSLAAKIFPKEGSGLLTKEDVQAIADRVVDFVRFIFVEPRVPDEAKPGIDIPIGDVEYALRWARGEVASDGSDLAAFRGRAAGTDPASGATGENLQPAPEPAPEGHGPGLPN